MSRRQLLTAAMVRQREAEQEIERILRRHYRLGGPISWTIGDRVQRGRVEQHGYGDKIKVENDRTGRSYWIYAFRIVD